jgi:hypothetical protein
MFGLDKLANRIVALVGVVAAIATLFTLHECSVARTAKTETKLATGQAGAAMQSGQDAANTVGNRMAADADEDATTRSNGDLIRNAQGSDAPVAAPARDAGLTALCRRVAYRDTPRCKGVTK